MWENFKVEIMPGVWVSAPKKQEEAMYKPRRDEELLTNLKTQLPELEKLLEKMNGHWTFEDLIYRFYHHSFKVQYLEDCTNQIVKALQTVLPEVKLNEMFLQIVAEGTNKQFDMSWNERWMQETRPIVEAFFHAHYFLQMAVRYGKELEKAPNCLPSGWASYLYLYDMR